MCIVSAEAKLSKTRILSMALDNGRHILSYSNKVQNLSGQRNSMILAIPGEVKEEWFYDTTEYNKFMEDIEDRAHLSFESSKGINYRGALGMKSKGFSRFGVGMYDIITTKDLNDVTREIDITMELLDFFHNHYKGWTFVVCMFSGEKEMDAQPIMFEYEPMYPQWLYFPTMDSHDGQAPDFIHPVDMDHSLMYEYPGLADRVVHNMKFDQKVPEILKRRNYVSTKWNTEDTGKQINGDMYLHIPSLERYAKDREFCYEGFTRSLTHPGAAKVIA